MKSTSHWLVRCYAKSLHQCFSFVSQLSRNYEKPIPLFTFLLAPSFWICVPVSQFSKIIHLSGYLVLAGVHKCLFFFEKQIYISLYIGISMFLSNENGCNMCILHSKPGQAYSSIQFLLSRGISRGLHAPLFPNRIKMREGRRQRTTNQDKGTKAWQQHDK